MRIFLLRKRKKRKKKIFRFFSLHVTGIILNFALWRNLPRCVGVKKGDEDLNGKNKKKQKNKQLKR